MTLARAGSWLLDDNAPVDVVPVIDVYDYFARPQEVESMPSFEQCA